jgi:hypothetical protein
MRKFAAVMVSLFLLVTVLQALPLLSGEPINTTNLAQILLFGALALQYAGKLFRSRTTAITFDPHATAVFRRPFVECVLETVSMMGLTAVGVISLNSPDDSVFGLPFGLLMTVVGTLATIMILWRGRSELRVSPAGIEVKGIKSSPIPWDAVVSISATTPVRMFDMGTIVIELRRTGAWQPKPQRRIPIIHPAKIDPDGSRVTLYSDFFGTDLSTLDKALIARQQVHAF